MTRDALLEAIQRAADEHPRQARRALHIHQADAILGAVLAEVREYVMERHGKDWASNDIVAKLDEWAGNGRQIATNGSESTNGHKNGAGHG